MAFDNMDYDFEEEDQVFEEPLPLEEEPAVTGGVQISDLFAQVTGNPVYLGVGALVVGLLIGLIFAWGIWPVKYVDASPSNLHQNFQLDWMRMVVDSYNLRQDDALANERISALGENSQEILQELIANPGDEISQLALQQFLNQYNPSSATGGDAAVPDTDTGTDEAAGEDDTSGTSRNSTLLLLACAISGALAIGLAAFYFLRMRNRQPGGQTAAAKAQEFSRQAMQTDYEAMGQDSPIAQWMTTYLVGDDLYDDSFSIDSLTGEFLGECGVGIADTIGVGEPKRVSAFEVWLFDKNDIQTVTKVMMSGHAMNDEATYARLEAKGEPVLATPGGTIELQTKTLRMVVRIMDMDYGTGHLPENSFFQRITLELAIWSYAEN